MRKDGKTLGGSAFSSKVQWMRPLSIHTGCFNFPYVPGSKHFIM